MWEFLEDLESFRGAVDGTTTSRGPPKALTIPPESRIGLKTSFSRRRSASVDSIVGDPSSEPSLLQSLSTVPQLYQQSQVFPSNSIIAATVAPSVAGPSQQSSTFPTMKVPGPAGRNTQSHKRRESSAATRVQEMQAKRQKLSTERARLASK
jgi:hypothetical protein